MDIPPEVTALKPLWPTKPTDAIREEILAWIRDKAKLPFMWRGNTHIELQAGSEVEFVCTFDSPGGRVNPCPLCTSTSPKYGGGVVLWVASLSAIVFIGEDCFKSKFPDEYRRAVKKLNAENTDRADKEVLLASIGSVPDLLAAVQQNRALAQGLDDFRRELRRACAGFMPGELIELFPEGRMRATVMREVHYQDGNGETKVRTSYETVESAPIQGLELIARKAAPIAPELAKAVKLLEQVLAETDNGKVEALAALTPAKRHELARALQKARSIAVRGAADLLKRSGFLDEANLATIRNWGARDDADKPLYVRRGGGRFNIGKTQALARVIQLAQDIGLQPASLPAMR